MQEAYVKIYQGVQSIENPHAAYKWIKLTAYRSGIDYVKKSVNVHETTVSSRENDEGDTTDIFETDDSLLSEPLPMPEDIMVNEASQKLMRDIIKELPERQQSALVAFYYNESSIKDIAAQTGMKENTIKSDLSRARKTLKEKIESFEKKEGIRFHSIVAAPVFMLLFTQEAEASVLPVGAKAAISSSLMAGKELASKVAATEGAAETSVASQGMSAHIGAKAAGVAGHALRTKVLVAVSALVIGGTGAVGASHVLKTVSDWAKYSVQLDVLADGEYTSDPGYTASISDDLSVLTIETSWERFGDAEGEGVDEYAKKEYHIPISDDCVITENIFTETVSPLSEDIDDLRDYMKDANMIPLAIIIENGEIVEFEMI